MYTFHEKERGSLTLIKNGEESEQKKGKNFILEVIAFFFFYLFWKTQMHSLIFTKMVQEVCTDRVSALHFYPSR